MPGKRKEKKNDTSIPPIEAEQTPPVDSESLQGRPFPVVGIGASAGGLEALKAFFAKVPETSGMAYVVVVHMAPKQPSMLPELLQRVTGVAVSIAQDGELLQANHVYVIPPDYDLSVYNGSIQLMDTVARGTSLPIDFFLRSLARDQQARAGAVILSGTGTDGTLGVKEINAGEGLVLAQSEESAHYRGMPRSAISTGVVDLVLPPEAMPEKIIQYFERLGAVDKQRISPAAEAGKDWLSKILSLLRTQIGHDFSLYKKNTIIRRINRRMGLNQINNHDTYIRFLRENPKEAQALFRELLIGVTNFFRDAPSFEALNNDILPGLLAQMDDDATFRAWIPGCSTGEEAYSLAMVLRECLDATAKRITLQLFGTDIDPNAIDKAREGVFPASISADVSLPRMNRFFTKEGDFFRISKEIRDSIVFSMHDVLRDPPFSRLHLLSCRNLLIYLDSRAQKKLLPLFHYTLTPGGILMLGASETIGEFTNLFHPLNNKWKIFQRREVPRGLLQPVVFPSGLPTPEAVAAAASSPVGPKKIDLGQLTQKVVLERFAPPAVLVDPKGAILHFVGRTGKYLEPASGSPTHNVLDMAREGLRFELAAALRAATTSGEPVTRKMIRVRTNGEVQAIDLYVSPLKAPRELAGLYLIVFADLAAVSPSPEPPEAAPDLPVSQREVRISDLEKELQGIRESHQITIEELESSNEELKSTCEELQSSNEELQSTNEEMESSKEELQSVNEELQTVNAELQSKLEELSTTQDDMRNLLNSTEIATIFVDNDMRVKRFTQEATTIINLIPTDIGRPLHHVATNLAYKNLIPDLGAVLNKLASQEAEVRTTAGTWYSMRIMPYRTTDNRIDGAVLTFTSIDAQKRAQEALQALSLEREQAWLLVRQVFDLNPQPLAVLDRQGIMVIANRAFSRWLNIAGEQIKGSDAFALADGAFNQAVLRTALEKDQDFNEVSLEIKQPEGEKRFMVHCQKIGQGADQPSLFLLQLEEDQGKGGEDAG
jgi:two-component system CheB/CheR fusion protein